MNLRADSIPPAARSWKTWLGIILTVGSIAGGVRAVYRDIDGAVLHQLSSHDDSSSSHPRLRQRMETVEVQSRNHEVKIQYMEQRYTTLEREILKEMKALREERDGE